MKRVLVDEEIQYCNPITGCGPYACVLGGFQAPRYC